MYGRLVRRALAGMALVLLASGVLRAQDEDEQPHDMSQMDMSHSVWMFMQDGVFNGGSIIKAVRAAAIRQPR